MENRNILNSLDDLSASELNAAIDDTNFPKNPSGSAASTPLDPNVVSQALGLGPAAVASSSNEETKKEELANGLSKNGAAKGIIRREHPTPLRMVSFRDDKFDVPGTPRTPRTSTTPGT